MIGSSFRAWSLLLLLHLLVFRVACLESYVPACGSANQIAVQADGLVPESNGCSKPPGINIQGEEDFTYCCDRHDVCYQTCNIDKQVCESDFQRCLKKLCNSVYRLNPQCSQAADLYVMGTSMFGGNGFADSQQTHCKCVDKDDVKQHYARLVHDFYLKNVPHKAHEWEDYSGAGRIASYLPSTIRTGSSQELSKVSKLVYDLYKKYDSSIRHVGNRRGRNPPTPTATAKTEL